MSKSSTCGLLGVSRQVYYSSLRSKETRQAKAAQVVCLVNNVRRDMPRIGFRKLYHIRVATEDSTIIHINMVEKGFLYYVG